MPNFCRLGINCIHKYNDWLQIRVLYVYLVLQTSQTAYPSLVHAQLKSVHFMKTVALLKEMRIAQLSSKNERTLVFDFRFIFGDLLRF